MTMDRKRRRTSRKFGNWSKLPWRSTLLLQVPGLHAGMARYVKEVDVKNGPIRFLQEVYDDNRQLVEIHEKYPPTKGTVG